MTTEKKSDSMDVMVEQLYAKLDGKKKSLHKLDHPSFTTPIGSFKWEEYVATTDNLNTFKVESLIKVKAHLMAKKYWYDKATENMDGKIPDYRHQNYTIEEWIDDIDTLINRMNITKLKSDIASLEARLSKLVSPEMQRQRELDKLAKEIENF